MDASARSICRESCWALPIMPAREEEAAASLTLQPRADVCARQLLGLSHFRRFAERVLRGNETPRFPDCHFIASAESLALLSISTNTLSRVLTEPIAFALLQAAFSLNLFAWPEDDALDSQQPCSSGLAAQRLARLIAAELRAEAIAESTKYIYLPPCVLEQPQSPPCKTLAPLHQRHKPLRRCLRCRCRIGAASPCPLCACCFQESVTQLSAISRACAEDLRVLPLLEAAREGSAPDGARFDFLNEFGRHALPGDDPVWKSPAYTAALIEHASGRSSDSANPRAGPLEPRLFNPHLKEILSSKTNNGASSSGGLVLRSVVGSGTEAVRSFWDIAEAYAPSQEGAQLLILRGAYVGGSGPQQSISGLKFVRDRSFASNAARRLEPFIVDAP